MAGPGASWPTVTLSDAGDQAPESLYGRLFPSLWVPLAKSTEKGLFDPYLALDGGSVR